MTLSIKDPGSALTHFIGMVLAGLAATPLLVLAAKDGGRYAVPALAIFAASMILLYGASTTYHTFNISEKVNKVLRKIDHMMIFILIAGSYTPICVIPLRDTVGIPLLILVWAVAIAGMLIKAFWITCPKWFSSTLHCHGLAVCACYGSTGTDPSHRRFYMAGGWWRDLHHRRCDLRTEASAVQCKASVFWIS